MKSWTIATTLLALTGLLLTTGCGGEAPTRAADSGKQLSGLQVSQAPQQGFNQQQFTTQLFTEMKTVRTGLRSISCDLVGFFVDEKTGKEGSNQSKFYFEQPNKVGMTIVTSTSPGMTGTKLVWTGGKQLAVKTKLVGFWVKTSIDYHDSRATDQRGFYIDETGINPMLDTLFDPGNQFKSVTFGQLNGQSVARLDFTSPKSLRGIGREVYLVEGARRIPVVREMYDKSNKLVFRIQLQSAQVNQTVPATAFSLD